MFKEKSQEKSGGRQWGCDAIRKSTTITGNPITQGSIINQLTVYCKSHVEIAVWLELDCIISRELSEQKSNKQTFTFQLPI